MEFVLKYLTFIVLIFWFRVCTASASEAECRNIAEVAASVMQQYQKGISYAEQEKTAQHLKSSDIQMFYMDIVEDAYTGKQLATDAAKNQAVQAFAKSYYDRCMSSDE